MQVRRGRVAVLATLLSTFMLVSVSPLASAAPVRFGAKLNGQVQPHPAQSCPDSSRSCTWIQAEAYQRPDGLKAPKDGTIRKIRIIAGGQSGSFRPVLARIRNGGDRAKVVRRGPLLPYSQQPNEEPPYQLTIYSVNMAVRKGDVLGIEAKRTSLLNCSGAFLPQFQPALPVGGGFRNASDNTGCFLLIEAQYG